MTVDKQVNQIMDKMADAYREAGGKIQVESQKGYSNLYCS